MDIKNNSGDRSEGREPVRKFPSVKRIDIHPLNVGRNEVLDGNMDVTENWRKGEPCYEVAKNLAELCSCSSVLWKVKLASDRTGYLAEKTSKQSTEGAAWFFLTAYS